MLYTPLTTCTVLLLLELEKLFADLQSFEVWFFVFVDIMSILVVVGLHIVTVTGAESIFPFGVDPPDQFCIQRQWISHTLPWIYVHFNTVFMFCICWSCACQLISHPQPWKRWGYLSVLLLRQALTLGEHSNSVSRPLTCSWKNLWERHFRAHAERLWPRRPLDKIEIGWYSSLNGRPFNCYASLPTLPIRPFVCLLLAARKVSLENFDVRFPFPS